jgi:hypothetical protein
MHCGTSHHFALDTDILRLLGRDSKRAIGNFASSCKYEFLEWVWLDKSQRTKTSRVFRQDT